MTSVQTTAIYSIYEVYESVGGPCQISKASKARGRSYNNSKLCESYVDYTVVIPRR